MRGFMYRFATVADALEIHDRDLAKRLSFHLHVKLAWYGAFLTAPGRCRRYTVSSVAATSCSSRVPG